MKNFSTLTDSRSDSDPPHQSTSIAIVGFGYWGQILAKNLVGASCVDIHWICDAMESNLETAKQICPAAQTTGELDTVLADDAVELVLIATPTKSHFSLAQQVLEVGKHVFVEKPFVQTVEEALKLKAIATRQNR